MQIVSKTGFDISQCQILFSGEKCEKYFKMSPAETIPRVLRVKVLALSICNYIKKSRLSLKCHFWWRFTAAKFTIRNFYNPCSQKCKPYNFLKSSSILTLMSLNSAFKHVSLLHSDNYKERPNIQKKKKKKKTTNFSRNNTLMMLSAISADEYKHNKQTVELDSASRTF